MLHVAELGFAKLVRNVAAGRVACRIWFVIAPLAALQYLDGRLAYVGAASALGIGQLASSLLGTLAERRVRARLYWIVGDALSGASGMVALPLPEAEPEIALARGIYGAARAIGGARPAIVGEGAALLVLALLAAVFADRVLAIPLGCGVVASALVYLALRKTTARLEVTLDAAGMRVFRHIVGFLSEREERIAYGLRASFLAALEPLLAASSRAELSATLGRALLRRLPIVAGLGVTLLVGYAIGLRSTSAATVLAITTWAQGAGVLLVAVADNIRLSREAEPFASVASLARQTFTGTRLVSEPKTIEARRVGYSYAGEPAVGLPSFVARRGVPLVLRGVNGSGKSTILRLLAGLALPTEGELTVDGTPFAELDMDAWRRQVVYLSQSPTFDPTSTVREAISAMVPDGSDEQVVRALSHVGFEETTKLLARPLGALSSGQRRRVHLARAIAAERSVMILDEPEAGLDAATEQRLRAYLLDMAKTRLVIVATHAKGYGDGCVLGEASGIEAERSPR